jgi:hypothetical protein
MYYVVLRLYELHIFTWRPAFGSLLSSEVFERVLLVSV